MNQSSYSCCFAAIFLASITLYNYKPERDNIILDFVRQVAIYKGILVVTCTSLIHYKTQEKQLKLLEMIEEVDDDFRRLGVEIKQFSFLAKTQAHLVSLVIVFIYFIFPYIHFHLDHKLWTLQFLCGSIGIYRGTLNFCYLTTIHGRFGILHKILIDLNDKIKRETKNRMDERFHKRSVL